MPLLRLQVEDSARIFLYTVPPIVAATLVLAGWRAVRGRRRALARSVVDGFLLLSVAGILAATLVPLRGAHEFYLVPFRNTRLAFRYGPRDALITTVGNLLLFMPFGFTFAAWVRGRHVIARALAGSVVLSIGVEVAQIWIPGRTTSIDDLILNAAGGLLGALFWAGITA